MNFGDRLSDFQYLDLLYDLDLFIFDNMFSSSTFQKKICSHIFEDFISI